jgi:membrane glycosyltransferase
LVNNEFAEFGGEPGDMIAPRSASCVFIAGSARAALTSILSLSAIPVALLIAGGLALAVPLCVVTANPAVGAALLRVGIGRLPEEIAPSPLDDLALPALKTLRKTAAS